MVAITTDSPRYTHRQYASLGAGRSAGAPHLRLVASADQVSVGSVLGRVLLVLAAVAVVVAVAVASAAFGRMLDSQRGIPDLGSAAAAVTHP